MARILSISYDDTLLRTREWMLRQDGHEVVSANGFHDAREACEHSGYDLFVLGHSIPLKDKRDLIGCFRSANPNAMVIALTRSGEARLPEVDAYISPGNPEELVNLIRATLRGMRRVK